MFGPAPNSWRNSNREGVVADIDIEKQWKEDALNNCKTAMVRLGDDSNKQWQSWLGLSSSCFALGDQGGVPKIFLGAYEQQHK